MIYKVKISKEAAEDFKQLDNSTKLKIEKYLKRLDNIKSPKAFGKALKNNLTGYWRYRIENYRIIAEILNDELIILVLSVGHRSTIYKKTDKRLNR